MENNDLYEANNEQGFIPWLETWKIKKGIVVIDGFCIINKWIALEDAMPISYCLN